jgi:hypothetical protein
MQKLFSRFVIPRCFNRGSEFRKPHCWFYQSVFAYLGTANAVFNIQTLSYNILGILFFGIPQYSYLREAHDPGSKDSSKYSPSSAIEHRCKLVFFYQFRHPDCRIYREIAEISAEDALAEEERLSTTRYFRPVIRPTVTNYRCIAKLWRE